MGKLSLCVQAGKKQSWAITLFSDAGKLGVGQAVGWGGAEHCSAGDGVDAGTPNISLLSNRLSVKLASSFVHPFDVSSWEGEQLGSGERLLAGLDRRWEESRAM